MSTRKSTRKKANCFEDLGEAVNKQKDSNLIDPSCITGNQESKPSESDFDFKESFLSFQNKNTAQSCHIECTFCQMTDSVSALHDSIMELHSHQNEQTKSSTNDNDQCNISSIEKRDKADDIDDTPNPSTDPMYDKGTTFVPNNYISHHNHSSDITFRIIHQFFPRLHTTFGRFLEMIICNHTISNLSSRTSSSGMSPCTVTATSVTRFITRCTLVSRNTSKFFHHLANLQ